MCFNGNQIIIKDERCDLIAVFCHETKTILYDDIFFKSYLSKLKTISEKEQAKWALRCLKEDRNPYCEFKMTYNEACHQSRYYKQYDEWKLGVKKDREKSKNFI